MVKNTHLPAEYHTFMGFSEYLRIGFNTVMWYVSAMAWTLTFFPVSSFHEFFGWITHVNIKAHALKYLFMILVRIGAFFADNYERDYKKMEAAGTSEWTNKMRLQKGYGDGK